MSTDSDNKNPTQNIDSDYQGMVHEYDGILEYDNSMPNWWLTTLWLSILFGVSYWGYYQATGTGLNSAERYQERMTALNELRAELKAKEGAWDEARLTAMAQDTTAIEAGKALFTQNCVSCHGAQGEGLIGPNLTDDVWLYGGSAFEVFSTIRNGSPKNPAMVSWAPIIGEEKVAQIAAFVINMPDAGTAETPKSDQEVTDQEVPEQVAEPSEKIEAKVYDAATLDAMVTDDAVVAAGKEVFAARCVACHGPTGEGGVGPNLTDAEWLYGGKPIEIFTTVQQGSKNNPVMMAWEPVIGIDQVAQVSAYVATIGSAK